MPYRHCRSAFLIHQLLINSAVTPTFWGAIHQYSARRNIGLPSIFVQYRARKRAFRQQMDLLADVRWVASSWSLPWFCRIHWIWLIDRSKLQKIPDGQRKFDSRKRMILIKTLTPSSIFVKVRPIFDSSAFDYYMTAILLKRILIYKRSIFRIYYSRQTQMKRMALKLTKQDFWPENKNILTTIRRKAELFSNDPGGVFGFFVPHEFYNSISPCVLSFSIFFPLVCYTSEFSSHIFFSVFFPKNSY